MQLWDEELESYRPEAQKLSEEMPFDQFRLADPNFDDPLAYAKEHRDLLISFEADPSPMAEDSVIAGPAGDIPVRLFVPEEPKAMYLHIHGGGWYLGRPQMSDPDNEHLAANHGLAVLSVDYRLAPEHPYPAANDDCEAAAAWMLEHGPQLWGTDKMFIGGESAGGHLAASTLLRVRDRLGAIDRVLGANLVAGMYDFRGTPSMFDNGGRPDVLDTESILTILEFFIPNMSEEQRRNPDLSPLFADLSGLPSCLVSAGATDHLADDACFLAARMAAAETPVELALYPDSPHGFTSFPSEMANAHKRRIDTWLASILS